MIRVVFVCLGNICRSPLAEGVFRQLVEREGLDEHIHVDSAGTGAWHVGEPPDPRSVEVARRHGVDITGLRGRQIQPKDLDHFDYVVAMDASNRSNIRALRAAGDADHVTLLLEELGHAKDVPDPYYGGPRGFDDVWDMVNRGCEALLARIREERGI